MRGDLGVSAPDAAKAETKALDPTKTQIQTARRRLDRLVDSELASRTEPETRGGPERRGAVYYITEMGSRTYEKQRSERSK
jgi:DNA-binding PadR family transcriptional regulator